MKGWMVTRVPSMRVPSRTKSWNHRSLNSLEEASAFQMEGIHGGCFMAIVITPLSLLPEWLAAEKWTKNEIHHLAVVDTGLAIVWRIIFTHIRIARGNRGSLSGAFIANLHAKPLANTHELTRARLPRFSVRVLVRPEGSFFRDCEQTKQLSRQR